MLVYGGCKRNGDTNRAVLWKVVMYLVALFLWSVILWWLACRFHNQHVNSQQCIWMFGGSSMASKSLEVHWEISPAFSCLLSACFILFSVNSKKTKGLCAFATWGSRLLWDLRLLCRGLGGLRRLLFWFGQPRVMALALFDQKEYVSQESLRIARYVQPLLWNDQC